MGFARMAWTHSAIEGFLKSIAPFENYLPHSTFNYLSVEIDGRDILLQGRLFFNALPPSETFTPFHFGSVKAGQYHFSKLNMTAADMIDQLLTGHLSTPHGEMYFPPAAANNHSLTHQPLHPAGLVARNRLGVLTISGEHRDSLVSSDLIDWELRSAERPYDSLQELLAEYRLGFISTAITFEAIIPNVVEVDLSCRVEGNKASIGAFLPKGLPRENVSLGYRVIDGKKNVVTRSRVSSESMDWEVVGDRQICRVKLDVPPASFVHCMASYAGIAQNFGYIVDPQNFPNDRRAVFEQFDQELVVLRELLFRPIAKGMQARDFEAAVSWLAWMLGFNTALFGIIPKLQEAPDIVLTTPSGHYLIVECTIGMLRAENKLATVIRRAVDLRDRLAANGSSHLNVSPVIVTALTLDNVKAELEQAERHGVVVITREWLENGLERTIGPPDAEQIYKDAMQNVGLALAKYSSGL
jgi:hypothetical protein